MSIKLTDTQLVLLGGAAQRKDLCLVAPPTLKGATAQKVASKLISAGLVKEVKTKASDPIWRRDQESGASYALKLTAAGAKAIAVDDAAEPEDAGEESAALANRDQAAILSKLSPSHAAKGGRRWRYYVSQAVLQGRKHEAGSVARVPALEIERRVAEAVCAASSASNPQDRHELHQPKASGRGASANSPVVRTSDDDATLRAAIERVVISRTTIEIELAARTIRSCCE